MSESATVEVTLQGDAPISETTGNVVKGRPDIISIDNKDFNKWADKQLGLIPDPTDPAEMAKAELVKVEAEKAARLAEETETAPPPELPSTANEGDRKGPHVFFKGKWVHKNNQNYRFHVKTAEAEAARNEAKVSRETAEAARREAAELRAKYEPPKPDTPDPEPLPAQFTDVAEYAKAIKEWTADNTRREDAKKIATENAAKAQEHAAKAWGERWTAATEAIPDFKETIESSPLRISDELRDATFESEFGPEIRYHLAKNPDYAEKIAGMTVAGMLKEVGRMEDRFEAGTVPGIPVNRGGAAKPSTKSADAPAKTTPVAEISRAPAPISPVTGDSGSGIVLSGSDPVPKNMSYESWKAARSTGRIR